MDNNLLIGIHKDQYGRVDPYLQIYEHILDYNGIKHLRLEASQSDFWEIVSKLDFILFHWVYIDRDEQMAESLIPIIEKEMKIKCFPNWTTFWHYNNKITQYYLLKNHGFPTVSSYIFWERDKAKKWLSCAKFPLVFKLSRGAFSQDVVLVNNKKDAEKLISRMFGKGVIRESLAEYKMNVLKKQYRRTRRLGWVLKNKLLNRQTELWWQIEKNYSLFQKFLPNNPYTTRITIIGDRAFAFNIKTAEGDFRAYDMGNINFNRKEIEIECIKIAFDISKKLGFQCMAYDFIFDEKNEPKICEMGYTSYALDIFRCPGYWGAGLEWHKGHFWPQYFQLKDLMDLSNLKQPDIDINLLSSSS